MVQAKGARVQVQGSKAKRKPKHIPKRCPYCLETYKGVPQSTYCSKYCMERACRRRKEALIETLADFLLKYSIELTIAIYGVPVQATAEQARRKAETCIEQNHLPFKLKLQSLGFEYIEIEKTWIQQARLPGRAGESML